ncbi:hypothetical protein Tco_0200169 [Tanacetum coccineum]
MLDKYVESLILGKNISAFVQGEVSAKMEDPGLFTLPCRLGNSKLFDTLADLRSCVNLILIYLFKKLNIELLEETDHIFGLADGTKSYHIGIVKDVEVHLGKLKLLNDLYEIAKDAEINPFKDVLVFRRMVEFLGAIPINLKRNMWESEDLINNPINWDKPPKNGDGAWMTNTKTPPPATTVVNIIGSPVTNTVANHAERPEKFNGQNFKRWQQKMIFYLTTLGLARFLKETVPQVEPPVEGQSSNVQAVQTTTAKELWESLEHKYKTEDAGTKKFVVARFLDYKMVDSKKFQRIITYHIPWFLPENSASCLASSAISSSDSGMASFCCTSSSKTPSSKSKGVSRGFILVYAL